MESPETWLTFDIEKLPQIPDGAVLRIKGEVDMATEPLLSAAFTTLVDDNLTEVIIDATGVTFMDSSGLYALIDGRRLVHEAGSTIVIVPSPPVRRLLELTLPEPLFAERLDTIDEAVTFLAHGQQGHQTDPEPT